MYGGDATNAGGINALNRTDPEFDIRIDRILDKYGNHITLLGGKIGEEVSDILNCEGISDRAGAEPEGGDSGAESGTKMSRGSHLDDREESEAMFHLHKPGKPLGADTLKRTGLRARFPDAGTKEMDATVSNTPSRLENLFARLHTARTCHQDGEILARRGIKER